MKPATAGRARTLTQAPILRFLVSKEAKDGDRSRYGSLPTQMHRALVSATTGGRPLSEHRNLVEGEDHGRK